MTNNKAKVVASMPSAIVGTIRFSIVLEESNFFPPLSGQDYTERKAKIFDHARLNRRFQLFEDVCLPSLKSQSDPNFNVMLVTSQELPDWALERLIRLVQDVPNIYVRAFRPSANIRRVYKRSVFELLDPLAPVFASFRLDDDDAISCDYVAQLRTYLTAVNIGNVITFSHGYQLALSDKDLRIKMDTRICGSAGLAYIQKGGVTSVPDIVSVHCLGGHRNVGVVSPVINDKSASMYVQTANGVNVSARGSSNDWDVVNAKELANTFLLKFPHLDENTLANLHVIYPD